MTSPEKNMIVLDSAYADAVAFTRAHYENFPVIGLLLPKELRKHVAVFYRFARQADDIADEGNIEPEERLKALDDYEQNLIDCLEGRCPGGFWSALKNTIDTYSLSHSYFFDLLSAFRQDIKKNRYADFEEVLAYCRNSANPVGRIILEFFAIRDERAMQYSDAVCTALQITNFYQDVSRDYPAGRNYIPRNEMKEFRVDEKMFQMKENNINFQTLLKRQVERARGLFAEGRKLIPMLPKNLKKQILLTILGGEEILNKISGIDYNVLNFRPALSKADYIKLFFKTLKG